MSLSSACPTSHRASGQLPQHPPAVRLTPREYEVLFYCAQAKTSWEIGRILGCEASTVNYHVSNILRKFSVSTRVGAVIKALRYGLLKLQ